MFNIDEIKELMALLEDSSLAVLEVEQGGVKVRLEKPAVTVATTRAAPAALPRLPLLPRLPQLPPAADAGKAINAPIVGVFYAAPSPDSEPLCQRRQESQEGRRRLHYRGDEVHE